MNNCLISQQSPPYADCVALCTTSPNFQLPVVFLVSTGLHSDLSQVHYCHCTFIIIFWTMDIRTQEAKLVIPHSRVTKWVQHFISNEENIN